MSINGWETTEMSRKTSTATLRVWRSAATGCWRAAVVDLDGVQVAMRGAFVTPTDAMDWADDQWRSIFP